MSSYQKKPTKYELFLIVVTFWGVLRTFEIIYCHKIFWFWRRRAPRINLWDFICITYIELMNRYSTFAIMISLKLVYEATFGPSIEVDTFPRIHRYPWFGVLLYSIIYAQLNKILIWNIWLYHSRFLRTQTLIPQGAHTLEGHFDDRSLQQKLAQSHLKYHSTFPIFYFQDSLYLPNKTARILSF